MDDEPETIERDAALSAAAAEHGAALVRYAHSLCGNRDAARDAVQETYLRLARQQPTPNGAHLAPWLFRVCRTRVRDIQRKGARMTTLAPNELPDGQDATRPPAASTELRDAHARVLREIDTLPANQREVVRLKFQAGMSYKQIAGVTELSVSNVGYLLHTALATLRKRLAAERDATAL